MKVDYEKIAAVERMIKECESAKAKKGLYFMCWSLPRSGYSELSELRIFEEDAERETPTECSAWYWNESYDSRLAHLHFALFRLLGIVK